MSQELSIAQKDDDTFKPETLVPTYVLSNSLIHPSALATNLWSTFS